MRRRKKAFDARLQRLHDAYDRSSETVADLDSEIRAVKRKLRKEREQVSDVCKASQPLDRRCERAREKVERLDETLRELRDDRDRAGERQQAALDRLNQAEQQ